MKQVSIIQEGRNRVVVIQKCSQVHPVDTKQRQWRQYNLGHSSVEETKHERVMRSVAETNSRLCNTPREETSLSAIILEKPMIESPEALSQQ